MSRYVYSLSPNQIEGENEGVKVRLQFTDDGNIITTDNIRMEEGVVSANYEMTIYDGGLNQSEIQAVFSAGVIRSSAASISVPAISWSRALQTRALPPTRS